MFYKETVGLSLQNSKQGKERNNPCHFTRDDLGQLGKHFNCTEHLKRVFDLVYKNGDQYDPALHI